MKRAASWVAGAAFLVLFYFFIDSVVVQLAGFHWRAISLPFTALFLLPPVVVTLVALALILRTDDERSLSRIALAVIVFSLLCRILWISVFDSYQVNDYGFYLNCGADVALSGTPANSPFCGSEIGYVYWKRAAFYTYPIVLMFGKSLTAIKLANVLLATLTAWLFFQSGKLILGTRVAAVGLLFFIWHPDLWYSMTLASHDVPGLFWLAVFFYFCALLQCRLMEPGRPIIPLLGISLCIGGAIFFLEVARSYHYGAVLALLIYTLVHIGLLLGAGKDKANAVASYLERLCRGQITLGRRLKVAATHACLLLAIPLVAYLCASRIFWHSFGVQLQPDEAGFTCYMSTTDVFGEGGYEEIDNWLTQCPQIADTERTAFAIRKVLQDVTYDPREFLQYLVRKNRALSRADDYLNWSSTTEHEQWDTTTGQVHRVNSTHLGEQALAVLLAHAVVLLLVAWRFALFPGIPFRLSEAIPILFSAAYYLMFLFLLETQSRYEMFFIFIFSWMAAQALLDLSRRRSGIAVSRPSPAYFSRSSMYIGGAVILVLAGSLFWSASSLVEGSFLTLRDQSDFYAAPQDELLSTLRESPRVSPIFVRNNYKQLMLAYPPGARVEAGSVMAVQRAFGLRKGARHHLRFFLSNHSVRIWPFEQKTTWDDTAMEYILAMNGRPIASGDLSGLNGNKYFSFGPRDGLRFTPKTTIQLILRNATRIERVDPNRGPILSLEYVDLQ